MLTFVFSMQFSSPLWLQKHVVICDCGAWHESSSLFLSKVNAGIWETVTWAGLSLITLGKEENWVAFFSLHISQCFSQSMVFFHVITIKNCKRGEKKKKATQIYRKVNNSLPQGKKKVHFLFVKAFESECSFKFDLAGCKLVDAFPVSLQFLVKYFSFGCW